MPTSQPHYGRNNRIPLALSRHGPRAGTARSCPTCSATAARKSPRAELDEFRLSLVAQGMLDLLAHEQVRRAVSIGHDWSAHFLAGIRDAC
jgi:hypothetical protein